MRMLRLATALLFLLAADSAALGEDAQPARPLTPPGASEALAATVSVEKALLREDLARHEKAAADRAQSSAALQDLYAALDGAVRKDDAQAAQALEEVLGRIESAERERADRLSEERALVGRIRERMRRIDLLEEQVDQLSARVAEAAGPLSARWDVVLLPLNQKGSFLLTQIGTIVSGTYTLEGGWTGSLRGTLVNRKVFLERIDSKLGRSAEFEGYLSGDGSRIRGSWRSYELSAQDPASGQWSATRRTQGP